MSSVSTIQEALNAMDALAGINTKAQQTHELGVKPKENTNPYITVSGSNASLKSRDLQNLQNSKNEVTQSILGQLENESGSRFKGRVLDGIV